MRDIKIKKLIVLFAFIIITTLMLNCVKAQSRRYTIREFDGMRVSKDVTSDEITINKTEISYEFRKDVISEFIDNKFITSTGINSSKSESRENYNKITTYIRWDQTILEFIENKDVSNDRSKVPNRDVDINPNTYINKYYCKPDKPPKKHINNLR